MCYLNDIYVYLRARSTNSVPRGRPMEHAPKPDRLRPGGRQVHGRKLMMRLIYGSVLAGFFSLLAWGFAPVDARRAGQQAGGALELIDPHVFRACADPRNLPFSNEAGEGFENKIAELFARKLGKSVAYTFYPDATGFIRNTLNAHRCDVVLGIAQGDDIVQPTSPYYRTSYVAAYREDGPLKGLESLSDPRLKTAKIGVVAGTPPASFLADRRTAWPDQVLCAGRRHAVRFANT